MENRELVLFFFILYDIITTICFVGYVLYLIDKNKKTEDLLEDMYKELAKIRKKWYLIK